MYFSQSMKKLIVLFLLTTSISQAQFGKSTFSKDPIINLENFDKQYVYRDWETDRKSVV